MHSKTLITFLFSASFLLAVFHDASIRMAWYYHYPWVDIPMHILGGFVVGLFAYILIVAYTNLAPFQSLSIGMLASIASFTLAVILSWEAFELIFKLTNDAGTSVETFSDIFFGLGGAAAAWGLIWELDNIKSPPDGELE